VRHVFTASRAYTPPLLFTVLDAGEYVPVLFGVGIVGLTVVSTLFGGLQIQCRWTVLLPDWVSIWGDSDAVWTAESILGV